MLNKIKAGALNEMTTDFGIYLYPELIADKYKDKIKLNPNIDIIKKYNSLFFTVNSAWQKTIQYETIFEEFYYENGNLDKFAQLEHHIHAYLQDMDTLRNKFTILFDTLKKDVSKVAVNKQDIDDYFVAGKEKIFEVFKKVSDVRNPHVHQGGLFMDADIAKAENAQRMLDMFKRESVLKFLNRSAIPEIESKLIKQKNDGFNVAKQRWLDTARKNNEQIGGFVEFMFKSIKHVFYKAYDIVPLNSLNTED